MHGKHYKMHVVSQTGLTLIALSLSPGHGGGELVLLHPFRSNTNNNKLYLYTSSREETLFKGFALSWVTNTHHVFFDLLVLCLLGALSTSRNRYSRSLLTVFTCFLWTCPNQRRRPLLITSSIGASFNMRQISSFRI